MNYKMVLLLVWTISGLIGGTIGWCIYRIIFGNEIDKTRMDIRTLEQHLKDLDNYAKNMGKDV